MSSIFSSVEYLNTYRNIYLLCDFIFSRLTPSNKRMAILWNSFVKLLASMVPPLAPANGGNGTNGQLCHWRQCRSLAPMSDNGAIVGANDRQWRHSIGAIGDNDSGVQ